jgi:hypothetical protein
MKAENATEEDKELTPFKRIYVPLSPAPAIAQPEPLRLRPTLVLSSNSHLLQYQYHCSPRSNHHCPWLTRSTGNIQDPLSTHALARLFSRHQQHFIELVDTDHPVFLQQHSSRAGVRSGVQKFRRSWTNCRKTHHNFSTANDIKRSRCSRYKVLPTSTNRTSPPSLPPFSLTMYSFYSDTHRLGHGPIRRHLLWQKKEFCTHIIRHSLNPI